MDIRKDVFEVRNISDDRNEVGQGTVEVTATDLIYIDALTNEKWEWPFKFLRKYGFEENIFTFEAGRRCPGGQGLYAFASERANEIHEAIIENIRERKNLVPTEKAPTSPTHSDSARFSGSVKSSTPSTSTEEDGSTSPVPHNLVKPALEPVRPIQREHLYDVPQCIQMKEREKALQATDASIPSEGELLSSNSGEHTNFGQPKKSSKFGRKGSNVQDSHAEVALVIAQDSGCGSVSMKGGKKDKQNVLSWLRKKSRSGSTDAEERAEALRSKSKKKKGRKRSGKGTSEHEDRGQLSDETDGFGMYENLKVAKLKKTAYSASCDMESLSKEESSSTAVSESSAIPQPSLEKLMTNSHSIDMPSVHSNYYV